MTPDEVLALRDLIADARELLTAPPDDPRRAEMRARLEGER